MTLSSIPNKILIQVGVDPFYSFFLNIYETELYIIDKNNNKNNVYMSFYRSICKHIF